MYELIQHQRLESPASSITFSNIPQTWTDLQLVISARTTTATYISGLRMEFNNNTSSVYSTRNLQAVYSTGPNSNSNLYNVTTASIIGFVPGSSQTASTFNSYSVTIPNYASTTQNKSFSVDGVSENNSGFSSAEIVGVNIMAGLFSSTAAISSIRLTIQEGNNFVAGSSATLYGVNRTQAIGRPKAVGGNITYANGYWVHTFTGSGTFYAQQDLLVDSLVVAGGAGGSLNAGGGGAGGFRFTPSQQLVKGGYPVLVGAGGAVGVLSAKSSRGADSAFNSIASAGGGPAGGGIDSTRDGEAGGSGGGGGFPNSSSGTGAGGAGNTPSTTPAQGFSGGSGQLVFNQVANGGGGGGAGGAGAAGTTSTDLNSGSGNGGPGAVSTITGSSVTYAAGGSGNAWRSSYGTPSVANSGNGGSAGYWTGSNATSPLAGSSGVVIIRYPA